MTDPQSKRKFAGPKIQELRRIDQEPAKVPPHKRERRWRLTVEWTMARTYRGTEVFTSRAARDAAKTIILREIEEAKKHKNPSYFGRWRRGADEQNYLKALGRIESTAALKTDPTFTETEDE